jgi:hypothetical protein
LVVSAAGADDGSGDFWGELKLPSSFICGRRKTCSIKSNPSVVESIIPCQKQQKMDQLKWNHVT